MCDVSELTAVEAVLKRASVRIYDVIQGHIGWTGDGIDEFCAEKSSTTDKRKVNNSGDAVLAMDELADNIIEEELRSCSLVAGFASEEREDFVQTNVNGKYVVVYDPLDGSQNIPVGLSVGAIYGVFQASSMEEIKNGDRIVAAGYALFSSALQFAFSTKQTPVEMSQYDFGGKDWVVYIRDHKRPKKGKTYAINEGSCANWDNTISVFVAQHLRGRSVRWMCCMVADVSRQLLQGGCFMYPCDKKYPNGRLRLVYEAIPLAFLWERAGNGFALASVDGTRVLDMDIGGDIHKRCGIIFLGEEEANAFNRVKAHAPEWACSNPKEKLVVARTKKR
mmetsp:Transcript_30867/g.49488  ORF Transcript_30867/g.49488 Transcript_30867/m.49488 type:complete len:335 (+) Transcript_30867:85-1089(+)